ncbi:actin-like ATPase domain-containing protein [Morchella conica CCBAS932]|uniref:Actin-like ATPase domain-containing protein n=1 Tax=Morchella conica CCBAS932 TaxID=1392247 RepID=A0A3N4KW12_9PEZI|nr:actin-like ATPase domain-containing protein [Morchella conica CCBAS932]
MSGIAHSLKVGIDFGTTYSGVAWAHTATPHEINVIQKWPSGDNATTDKVPTELKYYPDGYKWGCEVSLEVEKLVWIKLLLDPSQDSFSDELLAKTKALIPPGKEPVHLVIDFLTKLKAHIEDVLEGHFGKALLAITPIEYFLTVPAVWSDSAKAQTLYAAEVVGLGTKNNLRLISEPEAAAVYSLKAIQPNMLKVTDTFVVADCGGGTVDLISYEVTRLEPKLEVKECVIGSGGMCGSTYINRRFEAWVKNRIGVTQFNNQRPRSRVHMMKHFEEFLKRKFADDPSQLIYHCPVPGIKDDEFAGVEDGFLSISRAEMREIFDPVVNDVLKLVQQQVAGVEACGRKVSAVLLVGGFGASAYLKVRLKSDVCDPKMIALMNPVNAWSAVASGACQRGLEGVSMVKNQLARRSYGVLCVMKHNGTAGAKGQRKHVFVDPMTGELKIDNRVSWFIKKGDIISEEKAVTYPFYFTLGMEHNLFVENTLLACEMGNFPKNAKNPHVFTVCKLKTNLNVVPRELFDKRIAENGQPYYHIQFNLSMKIQNALVFAFEFKGKTYSSVEATFA